MSSHVSDTILARLGSSDRACQRLAAPITLPDSDTTPRSPRSQDYGDCPLPESAPSSLLGPGPVWSVAAFAQGFTAKGVPTGNRPIP